MVVFNHNLTVIVFGQPPSQRIKENKLENKYKLTECQIYYAATPMLTLKSETQADGSQWFDDTHTRGFSCASVDSRPVGECK